MLQRAESKERLRPSQVRVDLASGRASICPGSPQQVEGNLGPPSSRTAFLPPRGECCLTHPCPVAGALLSTSPQLSLCPQLSHLLLALGLSASVSHHKIKVSSLKSPYQEGLVVTMLSVMGKCSISSTSRVKVSPPPPTELPLFTHSLLEYFFYAEHWDLPTWPLRTSPHFIFEF